MRNIDYQNTLRCTIALILTMFITAELVNARVSLKTDVPEATQQVGALERGYRTGYSDGYQAGYRDSIENAARDYRKHDDYNSADRAYISAYGAREDYRDGYQQGFEIGYDAGFDRRGFDSTVSPSLKRRGATQVDTTTTTTTTTIDRSNSTDSSNSTPGGVSDSSSRGTASVGGGLSGTVDIPQDTSMRVELLTNLSTEASVRGDRFEARVIEPAQYAGAMVTGRVTRVARPGKVRGSGQLQLTFDQIRLPDGRFANFNAQVTEVARKGANGVGDVDPEGGVRGQNRTKDDVTKIGASTGVGAIIGAIAGGGKGAAIGAIIGAGVGTGGVIASRGKDIHLEHGDELTIRTSTNTRIQ